jgi:hypothetical protein
MATSETPVNSTYPGGSFTLIAARRRPQANSRPIGSPIRVCTGSLPIATCTIPKTAAPTYSKPNKNSWRRRYSGSSAARSADRHALHIIQARTAEDADTPTMIVAIILPGLGSVGVVGRLILCPSYGAEPSAILLPILLWHCRQPRQT